MGDGCAHPPTQTPTLSFAVVEMPVIGVTGGIGTGKSTVTRILGELGAVTFSADDAARETLRPGSEALAEVAAAFGPELIEPDGSLNRARLAGIVFADPAARQTLEKITHPRILALLRRRIDETLRVRPADTIIAVEVPLLFEAGMEDWFDHVVVVTASEDTQIIRARKRSQLSEEEARARIRAQMPLAEKAARATHVIENDGVTEELREAVERFWRMLHPG